MFLLEWDMSSETFLLWCRNLWLIFHFSIQKLEICKFKLENYKFKFFAIEKIIKRIYYFWIYVCILYFVTAYESFLCFLTLKHVWSENPYYYIMQIDYTRFAGVNIQNVGLRKKIGHPLIFSYLSLFFTSRVSFFPVDTPSQLTKVKGDFLLFLLCLIYPKANSRAIFMRKILSKKTCILDGSVRNSSYQT